MNTAKIDRCIDCFSSIKKNFIEGASLLYMIREDASYLDIYSSWGEFVETLGISQSGASKMLKAFRHYVIEGGVSQRKLEEVDMEKLYLATSLEGSPEDQLAKAEVLSRTELKAQKISETTGHECAHEETVVICKSCHQRLG